MLDIQKKLTNSFYALLSLPATAMGFALSIQIAALSWILSTQYNLRIDEVGIVWAAGPLAGIFGQIIVGLISDKVWFWGGRRRPFILIGGTIAALMLLALPNIHHINDFFGIGNIMVVAIMVALTLDLAINISFNPTRSVIADVTPDGIPRTKGYTWMQTISGTFGVLAYAIGAIFNNYLLIYFGAGLVFLFSIIPMFFISESKESIEDESSNTQEKEEDASFIDTLKILEPLWAFIPFALFYIILRLFSVELSQSTNLYIVIFFFLVQFALTLKTILKKEEGLVGHQASETGFKKVLAAHSFSWIGVQTMFVYIFAFIKEFKFGTDANLTSIQNDEIGRVISISFLLLNAMGALVPVFILEPVLEKIGRVKTHYLSLFTMAIGYLGIAFLARSEFALYGFMILCGIGWGAIVSLPFAIMSEKVKKGRMGLFMGLFNLSVVLPQLIVSVAIGTLVQLSTDKNIIFIISAISLAVSAGLWTLVKEERKNSTDEKFHPSAGH